MHQLAEIGNIITVQLHGFNKVRVVSIRMPKNGILLDQPTCWLSRAVLFRPYRNQRSDGDELYSSLSSYFVKTVGSAFLRVIVGLDRKKSGSAIIHIDHPVHHSLIAGL
jgi:hypothetical protein